VPADPSSAASSDPAPAGPAPVDKRRLRAEQGRERVVEALLAFFAEGETQPGAARIAERAGVSERSVFRYFDDLDALAAETVKRQIERVRDVYAPPPATGDLGARVDAIVEQRLRIHAEVAVASEAARRIEPRAESVHRALARRGQLLRDQVETQFAPELDREPAPSRPELLDALDAALAFEQIDQLRRIAGHSPARVRALTRRTLHALLTH
jgi:TetR/AcrR family transcriptional regulator, regulator of autoinduction and epiphytic fitness